MSDHPIPSGDGSGRPGPDGHPDQQFCDCGNAWYEGGLIAFEKSGAVNGMGGWLRCTECGAPRKDPIDD